MHPVENRTPSLRSAQYLPTSCNWIRGMEQNERAGDNVIGDSRIGSGEGGGDLDYVGYSHNTINQSIATSRLRD